MAARGRMACQDFQDEEVILEDLDKMAGKVRYYLPPRILFENWDIMSS